MNRAALRRAIEALKVQAATEAGLSQTPYLLRYEDTQGFRDALALEVHLQPHRHERTSWLICGGNIEWCYQCGAWRQLQRVAPGNVLHAAGGWNKPSGIGGENPAVKGEVK